MDVIGLWIYQWLDVMKFDMDFLNYLISALSYKGKLKHILSALWVFRDMDRDLPVS